MTQPLSERFFRFASEADLVHTAQNGQTADKTRAENELVRRSEPAIRNVVASLGARGADREDALQGGRIGFLAAIRRYDSSRGTSLTTFARMHIRGGALRELYAAKGRRQDGSVGLETVPLEFFEGVIEAEAIDGSVRSIIHTPSAFDDLEARSPWGLGGLAPRVLALSPDQQELLTLLHSRDMPMAQVARSEGTSRAAVSQRHATVIRRLRQHVNRDCVA